jgi:two-component system, cell cycle sensor histidine kinase and response regulator CckA
MSRESDRLQLLLSIATEGFWDWNLKTDQLYLSQQYCEVIGFSPTDTLFDSAFMKRIIHPDDHHIYFQAIEELRQGKEERAIIEYRILSNDGKIHYLECRCRNVEHDEDGGVLRISGTIVDITDKKKAEHELYKLNRALLAISACNQRLLHANNETELLHDICHIVVETGGYRMAWVGYAEDDNSKSVSPVAQAGVEEGFLDTLMLSWADIERGRGPTGTAIRTGEPCSVCDLLTDQRFAPWRMDAQRRGYASLLSLPLKTEESVFGALSIYSSTPDAFDREETKLLTSLADNLAYGLTMLRNRKAREQAEDELRQSEARYRSLFQNKQTVMLIIDPDDGSIIDANQAAAGYYGWEIAELCQMNISEINLLTEQEVKSEIEAARNEKRNHFLFRHRLANGSIRDVEVFSSPIPFHGKSMLYSIINDIAERTITEKALRDSERRFRSITEQIVEMVFVTDEKGCLTYVSPAIEKIFGYKPHEVEGHLFTEYMTQEDIPRAFVIFTNLLQDQLTEQIYEFSFITKTCSLFHGEVHIRHYKDEDSSGMIGLMRDITERKQYEQELLESKQFLKNIYDEVNHSIFVVDVLPDGSYHFRGINPLHEKLTGISNHEIIGKTPEQLLLPSLAESVIQHYDDCIRAGKSIQYEELLPFKGKEALWETVLNPVRNERGTIFRIIGTSTNITERKQSEEERAKLEVQLQQSQKMEMVGRLAGGIAHDFNNMLTLILGHSEMALELFDPSQAVYADLEAIRQAATRSADLTRQLLAFARKQIVVPKILDLNSEVEHMLPMLRRLIGEHITLEWKPCSKNVHLKIDPSQIDQIVVNLCVNARDAITGNGSITLETGALSARDASTPENLYLDYVTLSVSDDGCGIDQNNLDHIFEPFFTTKEPGKGTGLGLSTVYGIVKQNKGMIECRSEPERGTTFTIHLPLYREPLQATHDTPAEQSMYNGHQTILLVEDEPAILELCKSMLESNGYRVFAASTPSAAIKRAENYSGTIDLLVTDVIMPEMNGYELSKRLRAGHPDFKTLFMSGYTDDTITHNTLCDTGHNFIQKPFTMKSMVIAVYTILKNGK